jgi:hypothetical protein
VPNIPKLLAGAFINGATNRMRLARLEAVRDSSEWKYG